MMYSAILVACCCCSLIQVQAAESSPRIIIIGSGASGIAAASRLLQNGFDNVKILEAENRIGGRIYTTEFGGYHVDLGGQWVDGEKDNVAFELAWPLGVIERSTGTWPCELFSSSGSKIPQDTANNIMSFYMNLTDSNIPDQYLNGSIGEFFKLKIDEYFESNPGIKVEQRKPLEDMMNLFEMCLDAGDSWLNISAIGIHEYAHCDGDHKINWKDKGYSTILDILMKKFPNPEEELPILNNTVLNTEVVQINYNVSKGPVTVVASNGNEYLAEHVILTPSLGVLKSEYKTLFDPSLTEEKINVIQGLEFGSIAKIYLHFPQRWWPVDTTNGLFGAGFYWTEEDKNEFANDPEKSWMLGILNIVSVEHKPQLLCAWLAGPHAREMEKIPEDLVFNQTKAFLHRFLGKIHNITEPSAILRSQWFSNKHFRGTYSYRSLASERSGATALKLSEPISKDGIPLILFAGEATIPKYHSTVNGAIGSGWREADRLIQLYADRKINKEASQS